MPRSKNVESYPTIWVRLIHTVESLGKIDIKCKDNREAIDRRNQYYAFLQACEVAESKWGKRGDMEKAAEYRNLAIIGRGITVKYNKQSVELTFQLRDQLPEVLDLEAQLDAALETSAGSNPPDEYIPPRDDTVRSGELDDILAHMSSGKRGIKDE